MPACIVSLCAVIECWKNTLAHVYHIRNLAPVSKENKCCTSQHTHIAIVESVHRLHNKTCLFLFFVCYGEWLKHIHVYVLLDRELGLRMSITLLSLPISHDSDVTSFLTAGPGRTINWLIKIEGHCPSDNNEVSRALLSSFQALLVMM